MRIYAIFDATGLFTQGFWDDGTFPDVSTPKPGTRNPAIPSEAVVVGEDHRRKLIAQPGAWRWTGSDLAPYAAPSTPPLHPDGPTLSDGRVGLTIWGRIDDVTNRVAALAASTDARQAILGKVAKERLEYANNVLRAQLMQLKDALGFTDADVDESLWRAGQVAKGDLSGTWPLPAS